MADDDAREWELERLRDANEALRARNTALEAEVRHLRRPAVVFAQCAAHAGQPFALQVPHAEPLRHVCPQCQAAAARPVGCGDGQTYVVG